jgi:hypothetical protein
MSHSDAGSPAIRVVVLGLTRVRRAVGGVPRGSATDLSDEQRKQKENLDARNDSEFGRPFTFVLLGFA